MIEFDATYYDALSSRALPVRVVFDASGMLQIQGRGEPASFPLDEVNVSARLGNTSRFLKLPSGAKCETIDNDAVDRMLRKHGVATGSRIVHWLESNIWSALVALLFTAAVCFAAVQWGVPWGARKVAYAIPIEVLQTVSAETLDYLDTMVLDPTNLEGDTKQRLSGKFKNMTQLRPELRLKLHFRSGDGVGPNAFALPDGSIVVTDELVELATNDEQILSVLAHEIGHVDARHALRSLLENSAFGLLLTAITGEISSTIGAVGALPAMIVQAKYSRELENEADGYAMRLMAEFGIANHQFADIMQALTDALPDYSDSVMSTHPPSDERIKRFRQ